jgi:hypothetical protein
MDNHIMAEVDYEEVMHKRETIMADERRKLYFFTFGDESADAAADTEADGGVEETTDE